VTANIWPGFVDAVTSLLMVMTFVLTIFIVVQYVLREEISGQESELNALTAEIAGLTRSLGLADARTTELEDEREALRAETQRQSDLVASLQSRIDRQEGQIASFEEQVASLLARQDRDQAAIAGLEGERDELVSDREALNLALAQARDEIDIASEQARLAAARREALEALVASLRTEAGEQGDAIASLETALSEEEAARLTEAAAAEALRDRLSESEAELTAMSLALEEQRQRAEETLTLLAAAESIEDELNARLAAALLARDEALEDQTDLDARLTAALERNAELSGADERLQAALTAQEAAEVEIDRTDALLQLALAEQDEQAAEMAAISDALEAAKAARIAFAGDLEDARARLAEAQAEVDELRELAGREADERDRLAAALTEARAESAALREVQEDRTSLRDQLEEALALRLQAETRAQERLTEAERQAALLATAREELSQQETLTEDSQRQVSALNAQVAQLRQQLSSLQGLLDLADEADVESQARIETLGQQLNAALAREAIEQKRRAELEAAERARLENYQSEFFGRLREVLGDREGIQIVGDRFVFSSEVLFPSGSATLSDAGRAQVDEVASLLNEVSDEIPDNIDWVIRVDGHTDDVPISGTGQFADNWELSQARALSVVRFMADELNFPEWRLAPTGFGEYRPVDPRQTPEARAANRRIELKLTER